LFAVYDISDSIKIEAYVEMSKIIFIAIVLWVGSFFFLLDINNYVIKPLNYTIKKIISRLNHLDMIVFAKGEETSKTDQLFDKNEDFDKFCEANYICNYVKNSSLIIQKLLGIRGILIYLNSI
jgi:hypothetical protein